MAPVFKRLGIIEQWGNGLKIISEELKNYPEIGLDWKEPGIAFRVTFFKKNFIPDTTEELFSDASEKTSEKILELIENNKNITIKELSESVGVSTRSIERNLTKLQKDKKLKRVGGDKGGYWEIMKHLK